jgi:hypothetical protein
MASISTFKLKQKSPKSGEPSIKLISKVWNDICKSEALKIATDWWDETVNDLDFEKSYFDPLGSEDKKTESKLNSQSQQKIEKVDKMQNKSQNGKRKRVKTKKSAPISASLSPKDISHEGTHALFAVKEEPASLMAIALEPSVESSGSGIMSEKEIEIRFVSDVDHEQLDISDCNDFESHKCDVESLIPEDSVTFVSDKGLETEPEEIVDDWEDDILRERKRYELEKKKLAQIRKVIHQRKADQEKSERQAKVRQNLKSVKSKGYANIIDSTELCLAYPDSYNLFLSNKGICSIKARQYRWFFDQNVVIRQENMNFLCILFNLEPGKGQLNFLDMFKAYWAIEDCFGKGKDVIDLSKTVFKWSHRFEVNNFLCPPFKKSVHAEHESSRFNHIQARELFSSGGFDPRFFMPEY